MASEERLVERDVLDRPDAGVALQLLHAIHQQKWVAVGQLLENSLNIHHSELGLAVFLCLLQGLDAVPQCMEMF
ncbi:hypothetical protein D3C71_1697540 [compost metagenome]